MRLLIKNAKALVGTHVASVRRVGGAAMAALPMIEDGWLLAENGVITALGPMATWPGISDWNDLEVIDASDRYVLPGWCDPHTHTVFAAPREEEFVDKIKGLSYQDIAARGGGIMNSAQKLRDMDEETLFLQARERLRVMMHQGTVAVEIKSGYGLSLESELKMLRVVKRLKQELPLHITATLLAATAMSASSPTRSSPRWLRKALPTSLTCSAKRTTSPWRSWSGSWPPAWNMGCRARCT
jgi:imidazolonepropionase